MKVSVATASDICVSYCGGRRHPCQRLDVVELLSNILSEIIQSSRLFQL